MRFPGPSTKNVFRLPVGAVAGELDCAWRAARSAGGRVGAGRSGIGATSWRNQVNSIATRSLSWRASAGALFRPRSGYDLIAISSSGGRTACDVLPRRAWQESRCCWPLVILAGGIIPAARSLLSSPISEPDRVCVISLNGKFRRLRSETLLDLASAWKGSRLLDAVAPYSWGPSRLVAPRRTVPILAARVAPEFFQVLGLKVGNWPNLPHWRRTNCSDCVLLSQEIWQLQFHGDPAIVGQQVTLDGSPRTVIGVLPRNFNLLSPEIAVWALLDSASPSFTNFVERIGAVARMKPTVTAQQVEADLADRTENAGYVLPASLLVVTPGRVEMRRYVSSYLLFVLLAMACSVLIVYARSGWRGTCTGQVPRPMPMVGVLSRQGGDFAAGNRIVCVDGGSLALDLPCRHDSSRWPMALRCGFS